MDFFVYKLNSLYGFHTLTMGMVSSFFRDRSIEVDGKESTLRSLQGPIIAINDDFLLLFAFLYYTQMI
jgi:hypothetical protein